MIEPEASSLWYRVADLKARLRDHVRIHRHRYRGQLWYILQDGASTRHYRFGPGAYRFLRLLDGERTVEAVWTSLGEAQGKAAPSQQEVVTLLASLHAADLLQCDVAPDSHELFARHQRTRRARWKQYLHAPLMIRIPLLDPDAFLERWTPACNLVFGRLGFLVWLALVALAAVLAVAYWPELSAYWGNRALAPYNLALLVAAYPVVKGLHELAHGMAVKCWGGEVHETGITLLLFLPVPYVEASAAAAFRDKRRRMLVGAAGIMAELALGALALLVWLTVETGVVRDLAFDVMLIGGISTLLFNGNPLLRFDGYYVLADAIEIPNLAPRSSRYYGYLAQRYLLGVQDARSPVSAPGEAGWFAAYGLGSYVYRLAIMVTIVLFVAEQHLLAGLLVGALVVASQLVRPALRHLEFLARSQALRGRRLRATSIAVALGAVAIAVLGWMPIASSTYAEGVLWLAEDAQVRAGAQGIVRRVLVSEDTLVRRGEALFEIADPLLEARVNVLEWELREREARRDAQLLRDRVESANLERQIERARADLAEARGQAAELTVRSPAAGILLAPDGRDLEGRFARKGDVLGYVTDHAEPTIRVVVGQDGAGQVRQGTHAVRVKLANAPRDTLAGRILREVPSATSRLPSKALGTLGGGKIAVDAGDAEGLTASERIFVFDVALPAGTPASRAGTRAYVRFEHAQEALARQWYRSLRQLLLRRLSV